MSRRDLAIGLVLIAVAIAFPWLGPPRYLIGTGVTLFCYAAVVSQWNLVFGVAGIFSLAQVAIFAFGAYVTAVLGRYAGWDLWYAFPVAGVAGVVFSLLIGLGCLRLRGIYVALLTLAIAQVMFVLIQTDAACSELNKKINPATCISFTGGAQGLGDFGSFGWRDTFGGRYWLWADYYTMLVLLVIAQVVAFVLINSRIGLAFKALRDNPELARSRGISQFKYQLLVFALSAFLTAVAGGFFAAHYQSVGTGLLSFNLLLFLISMLIVGGLGRPWGPLLGALLLMAGEEVLKEAQEWRNIGLGLLLLVVMLVLPDGVAGALEWLWNRAVRQLARLSPALAGRLERRGTQRGST
jgi:branched-chain amino acid transport system permease protein